MKMFNICLCMSCLFCFCWKQARYFSVFSWLVTFKKQKNKKTKKNRVTLPCFFSLYFSLLFSITPFPQEQTWDWLCIGVSPASICLTSGPAFLHPHEREQRIKKRGGMDEGARERKREVCLCPKGLVSVCPNQEVRMWQQERQSRDVSSVCVCVCVCVFVWTLLSWGVIYAKITVSS